MKNNPKYGLLKTAYVVLFFFLTFTGFGQMPIFKRYYIADIPGLGWTADFYLIHTLHTVCATLLMLFVGYVIARFFLSDRKFMTLTFAAYLRIVLIGGLVVSGIFRVIKAFPNVAFSPQMTQFIDIAHMGLMMLFLFTVLILSLLGKGWVAAR